MDDRANLRPDLIRVKLLNINKLITLQNHLKENDKKFGPFAISQASHGTDRADSLPSARYQKMHKINGWSKTLNSALFSRFVRHQSWLWNIPMLVSTIPGKTMWELLFLRGMQSANECNLEPFREPQADNSLKLAARLLQWIIPHSLSSISLTKKDLLGKAFYVGLNLVRQNY